MNMATLPFKPAPPGQPAKVKTLQAPVMPRRGHGETLPVGDDAISKALAALPFAGNTVGAGIVPFPRLTLKEYTSLRADLAVRPERWVETLRTYHVLDEPARAALDEHWRKHFAAEPEARAAFEKDLAEFTAWLRTTRQ